MEIFIYSSRILVEPALLEYFVTGKTFLFSSIYTLTVLPTLKTGRLFHNQIAGISFETFLLTVVFMKIFSSLSKFIL